MAARDGHPAHHPPRRPDPVSLPVQLTALAAGPAAWALQLVAGYGLSSLACFPHDAPFLHAPPPGWRHEKALLLAINLACLLFCAAGALVSLAHWRRARAGKSGEGRARFLAACGTMAGPVFAAAILFDTAPILGAPACWSIAP